jgi:hypothetical protein
MGPATLHDHRRLTNAKGFKYDRNAMTWVPEEQPATTGTQKPSNR